VTQAHAGKPPKPESELEALFDLHMLAAGLPTFQKEVMLIPGRRYRVDRYLPAYRLAVELEGGTYMAKSRHTSPTGFESDCVKYNELAIRGITLLRFTRKMIDSGMAVQMVLRVVAGEK
jgi:very-short-patch-repair endonuclease